MRRKSYGEVLRRSTQSVDGPPLLPAMTAFLLALLVVHAASLNPVSKGCHYVVAEEPGAPDSALSP